MFYILFALAGWLGKLLDAKKNVNKSKNAICCPTICIKLGFYKPLKMGRWDEVDPRVQWAMDILDDEGIEMTSLARYHSTTAFGGIVGAAIVPTANWMTRRPLFAAIQYTVLGGVIGLGAGRLLREFFIKRGQEEMAVAKHYIMTHPEKFPEPEKKKYGDKSVVLNWEPCRV